MGGVGRAGLESLNRPENRVSRPLSNRAALDAALARAKALAASGQAADAAAIFRALEELFRDDPAVLDTIRQAKDGK